MPSGDSEEALGGNEILKHVTDARRSHSRHSLASLGGALTKWDCDRGCGRGGAGKSSEYCSGMEVKDRPQ